MMKMSLAALSMGFMLSVSALAQSLEGFDYNPSPTRPDGREWQSPERLALNKEQPRAWAFSFATEEEARKVLPYGSTYYQTLDGTWKFRWVAEPSQRDSLFWQRDFDDRAWDDIEVPGCWNVQGLQKDGSMKYGVPIYVNQKVIFQHSVRVDDWRGGVMRTPPTDWTTYKYRNEVGSYRRTFTVPAAWKGRQVFINFDGVDSFFYLWINGHYVGFSKNSRNTARFNITPYLAKKGENTVAVEVYRNSDGSFLEAQDMFRLPGIFRSTYLTSTPEVTIDDLAVRTTSLGSQSALIDVQASVRNLRKSQVLAGQLSPYTLRYDVRPVRLYTDETEPTVATKQVDNGHAQLTIPQARRWSAEEPNRYVLVATLLDKKGRIVDIKSTYFGVRTVEIRDTKAEHDEFGLAGRYFYVNNRPVKLKGVNRHENNPSRGHAITHEQMEKEVMLMKQGNINHVRNSHYSCDPYWYYLCDKYGIYLEDEANIESHEYYYGDASLSHPAEWRAAHVARNMELVHAHINAPSIVIWSLGNEAGPGDNFKAAYEAIKAFDTSRPVQYERNNSIVDMGSNQYPSVAWVRQAVMGKANVKYPYHISEYAHSMGNSLGNLIDYWQAIESTNFFCGGAIWDWVDQAIDGYKPDGTHYFGYGGDHGDRPNDGMFCMNGIMLPDLQPKPQYYEVKKVYQNVEVKPIDMEKGLIEIFNKNYFTNLSDYEIRWYLCHDNFVDINYKELPAIDLAPRERCRITLPYNFAELKPENEYFIRIEFKLRDKKPWAKKGYTQMEEQLLVKGATGWKDIASMQAGKEKLVIKNEDWLSTIAGETFEVTFNNQTGLIERLNYGGKEIFLPGGGPQIDALRAPTDNDNWMYQQWYPNGLHNLKHKAQQSIVSSNGDGSVSLQYTVVSQGERKGEIRGGSSGRYTIADAGEMKPDDFHFTTNITYTVYPDGSIEVESSIVSSDPGLVLPRLGYAMQVNKELNHFSYYGRGPLNNYADRKSGSFVDFYDNVWNNTVEKQFVNFPKPQSMGNREEVRWCALDTGRSGQGVLFVCLNNSQSKKSPSSAVSTMSVSALPWSAMEMTLAPHPCDLPQSSAVHLHLDCQVTGLGGNSCGQGGPLEPDRVKGAVHQMGFLIRPITNDFNLPQRAKVTGSTTLPMAITRNKVGKVSIISEEGQTVMYQVNQQAAQPYTQPFDLREGGTVVAWYQKQEEQKTTSEFGRIESVPVEVIYTSSEELSDGSAAKNLVDGNTNTIWHTMYSVTQAKYPHWVDFDCGEEKLIKGFTYLPRQDGPNGDVKKYSISLSTDGKTWTAPVSEGEFARSKKEQKVLFATPQRARYLRFTALSSQNGADYASGAEFTVLAE
ncbi:MAG: discoidin domain-containing protein [Bacteroidaceae bacterium]|nr:discoidin domain-containing protein [Bacteroidaceae bacterium]